MFYKVSKDKVWDYFILIARFLLAITFIGYGYSKVIDGQFGLSEMEMNTAIKDLSLFKTSWYLFDHEPFKSIIGFSQIICGLLLLFNKTAIIGAFVFLPIVATILIIDLTIMPETLAYGFTWRLSAYILLDILILLHYKEKMIVIWKAVWVNVNTKYKFPILGYLLLPLFAIILEIAIAFPKIIVHFIMYPSETVDILKSFLGF